MKRKVGLFLLTVLIAVSLGATIVAEHHIKPLVDRGVVFPAARASTREPSFGETFPGAAARVSMRWKARHCASAGP